MAFLADPPDAASSDAGPPDGTYVMGATPPEPARSSRRFPALVDRRTLLIGVPTLAGLAAAGAVTGYLLAGDPPADPGRSGLGSAEPPTFPTDTMLIRLDQGASSAVYSTTPGSGQRQLLASSGYDVLPQWSHDRKRIAYIRRLGTGASWQIWIMDPDGGHPALVVDKVSRGTRVCWSRDDRQLAYVDKVDGRNQLFAIAIGESGPRQITRTPDDKDDPSWAPLGDSRIAMWSTQQGRRQIVLLRLDQPDTSRQRLTNGGADCVDPCWSPDGSLIAYTHSKGSGQAAIWVVKPDGTGDRAVTSGTDVDIDPTWSPDGSWIAFTRIANDKPAIYAVRPDGSGLRRLTVGDALEAHASWS